MDSGRRADKRTSRAYVDLDQIFGALPEKPRRYEPSKYPRVANSSTSARGEKRAAESDLEGAPYKKNAGGRQAEGDETAFDPCHNLDPNGPPVLRVFRILRQGEPGSLRFFMDEENNRVYFDDYVDIFIMYGGVNVIEKYGGILGGEFAMLASGPCENGSRFTMFDKDLIDTRTLENLKRFYEDYNGPLMPGTFQGLRAKEDVLVEFIKSPDEETFIGFDMPTTESSDVYDLFNLFKTADYIMNDVLLQLTKKKIINFIMEHGVDMVREFVRSGCGNEWNTLTKFGVELTPAERQFYMEYLRDEPYYDNSVACRIFVRLPNDKRNTFMDTCKRRFRGEELNDQDEVVEFNPRSLVADAYRMLKDSFADEPQAREMLAQIRNDGIRQGVFNDAAA